MIIGVPKEIKEEEYRVALTPEDAKILAEAGHRVLIEKSSGEGSGFSDEDYQESGAEIVDAKTSWSADLVVKVKEPQESEFEFLRPGLILFTFLHLAVFPKLTKVLQERNVTAIDYATVELEGGSLPLLKPMSEIAGKLAAQKGAQYLEKLYGGKGVLLGGTENASPNIFDRVAGVPPANVLILGAGTVGSNAAKIALGLGARVIILERNPERCKQLIGFISPASPMSPMSPMSPIDRLECLPFSEEALKNLIQDADLLIGAVLVPGAKAPMVVSEAMVKMMKPGSVIVDVAIDQGGCIETSRPTTHKNPIFVKHGVIHYCVANMPGIVPRTSTLALCQATLPYILGLANKGFGGATKENPSLAKGVNVHQGKIVYPQLTESLNHPYRIP